MKKYNLIKVLIVLLIFITYSCENKSSKAIMSDYETVDDIANTKNLLSSHIENNRIIRLETSPECLMGAIEKMIKQNSLIFIETSGEELLMFDDNGNFVRKFGKKGKGPGEYLRIQDFAVNNDASVVAICCLHDIYFYDVNNGHLIRKETYSNFINNLFYLPNNELLVRVTQADFLIAHIDSNGNLLKTFGSANRVSELTQAFEFIKLDDTTTMYRIGETTDFYQYDYKQKNISKRQIIESKYVLREDKFNQELKISGPDYRFIRGYVNNYYRIKYVKKLKTDFLLYYIYKEDFYVTLYNPNKKTKQVFIFNPAKSSNLTDDVFFLQNSNLMFMGRASTDNNSILTYLPASTILHHLKNEIPDEINHTDKHEEILNLLDSLKVEDNPVLFEFNFKEI